MSLVCSRLRTAIVRRCSRAAVPFLRVSAACVLMRHGQAEGDLNIAHHTQDGCTRTLAEPETRCQNGSGIAEGSQQQLFLNETGFLVVPQYQITSGPSKNLFCKSLQVISSSAGA